MSNEITLSSLAMLKVKVDNGQDYLDYLRPYILQVLPGNEHVTDFLVMSLLRDKCGLEIPTRTINIILQRFSKEKILIKRDGVFYVDDSLISNEEIDKSRIEAMRHVSSVVDKLILFYKNNKGEDLAEDVAVDCLIEFLSNFSIPCLKSYLRGTTLPIVSDNSDWRTVLVSQFINEISCDVVLFPSFMMLVQGHMLANALLCPDLKEVTDTYRDVVFYFDTPLLIQLLGLEGEQKKSAALELIDLVKLLGGRLHFFSHIYDELKNVIYSTSDYIDSQKGKGTIVDEARKSGRTKSDLILVAEKSLEYLNELGLIEERTPPYDERTHKFEISEKVFESVLGEQVYYNNSKAKENDIKSVRSIYVLRNGTSPHSIEKSKAVLVTNNSGFSKAAFEYGKKFEQSKEISAVITDFSLANTAWLKAPQGAPSLPQKNVLAFAYAASQPTAEFWGKVLAETDKLERIGKITPRDHQLLRSSYYVQTELMKLTLGEDEALTEESITEILNRASDEIRKEEAQKNKILQEKNDDLEGKLRKEENDIQNIKKRIYWSSDTKANREAIAISIMLWSIQIFFFVFGYIKSSEGSYLWDVFMVLTFASGLLRLVALQWDIKPLSVYKKYREWRRTMLVKDRYKELLIED